MQIYELKLKPISSWITDLTADTIFWHLCWQIKYEFGDEVLEKFLDEMKEKPIFTISDVLPADRLPRILTDFDSEINETTKRWYKRNKRYKNINLISIWDFKNYFLGKEINPDNILNAKKNLKNNNVKFDSLILENKNIINRFTWTTWDNWIYSQESKIPYWLSFSLFIKILNEEKFKEYKKEINWKVITLFDLIKNIFEKTWYWKKKSTWKWVFEIIEDWQISENLKENENWNHILLLSNFIPSKNDPIEWNYKLFTKFPKLGEEFSLEWQNFYKKPLVMIKAWATFTLDNVWEWNRISENDYKWYVWRMIENVEFGEFYRDVETSLEWWRSWNKFRMTKWISWNTVG